MTLHLGKIIFIKDLVETVDGNMFATVKYEIDGTTHDNIPFDDLTMKDYHANFSCMSRDKRKARHELEEMEATKNNVDRKERCSIDICCHY